MNDKESTQHRGWVIASMTILIMDVIGFMILAAMTMKTQAPCAKLFNELGVALPKVTMFLVSIPLSGYLVFFTGLVVALLIKEQCIKSKPRTFAVNMCVAVGGFAYLSAYVLSMVVPLFQVIEVLQKGA